MRTGYDRKVVGEELTLTRVTYEAAAVRDEVKDFYRGVFRSGNWKAIDLDFSAGTWNFLMIKGARRASVEITPEGEKLVRISIRLGRV